MVAIFQAVHRKSSKYAGIGVVMGNPVLKTISDVLRREFDKRSGVADKQINLVPFGETLGDLIRRDPNQSSAVIHVVSSLFR